MSDSYEMLRNKESIFVIDGDVASEEKENYA